MIDWAWKRLGRYFNKSQTFWGWTEGDLEVLGEIPPCFLFLRESNPNKKHYQQKAQSQQQSKVKKPQTFDSIPQVEHTLNDFNKMVWLDCFLSLFGANLEELIIKAQRVWNFGSKGLNKHSVEKQKSLTTPPIFE